MEQLVKNIFIIKATGFMISITTSKGLSFLSLIARY